MRQVNFKADRKFIDLLDDVCDVVGMSRSEFIRIAILEKLEGYSVISTKVKEKVAIPKEEALEVV